MADMLAAVGGGFARPRLAHAGCHPSGI